MNTSGYVIIEGNIGAGKSTFAKALTLALKKAGVNAEYLPEPDENTNPFLADYYADPKRYAFTMQMHLLGRRYAMTQYAQWGALCGKGWFVMDRSYFGDLCFANVQRKQGLFTESEFASYVNNHKAMQTNIHFPSAAIFLRCDADECIKRINARMSEKAGRKCESSIDKQYLQDLQIEIDQLENFMRNYSRIVSRDWTDPVDKTGIEFRAKAIADLLIDDCASRRDFYSPWGACANALFR